MTVALQHVITLSKILMITVDEIGSSWKCPVDNSTEELLFDRLTLGEPRASRDLSFLDRQAGLDKDSAKPRRIEATATAVVRMESAEADTFLIDWMWRSLKLRHTFSLDRNRGQ